MLDVSEAAVNKVKNLLEREGHPEYGLRVQVLGGGCSGLQYRLAFDQSAKKDDKVIEVDGIKVFIDMKSSLYLVGSRLDYTEDLMGGGFKIVNPNAKSTCGCGESFSA